MLNKEMDLGYIIRQVRTLRIFLKTVLDQDQLALLKIKNKELIETTDNGIPSEYKAKKKNNKDLLLDNYINYLQHKTIDKQDRNLLEVLGFHKTL